MCPKSAESLRHGIYAFGERTPGRKHVKQGDWICFYATGKGVVAHASVSTAPENKPDQRVRHPQDYPYTLHVQDQRFYAENPVVVEPCGRNAKSDPRRCAVPFCFRSAYGLRSSRTELCPLNLNVPGGGPDQLAKSRYPMSRDGRTDWSVKGFDQGSSKTGVTD